MSFQYENIAKLILVILLFLCLADMSYGFYQLVRFLALVIFSLLAYNASTKERQIEMSIYIILAVLFQPFFKISLGRTIWNLVDIIVGVGLLISIFISNNRSRSQSHNK